MLIFDSSHRGRYAKSQRLMNNDIPSHPLPSHCLRENPPKLPELSELQVVRHFTRLSQENFSVDTHFYPLGSCTMKYNPKAAHVAATAPGFLQRHPLAGLEHSQGFLRCAYELQSMLQAITGMDEVSLTPMAGAQGELAGVLMIRAYHRDRNDHHRTEMLVPDSAHGTNPATAVMCGYEVKEIPTSRNGDLDLNALQKHLGPKTAGIMLTNPSTLGLFERQILSIAEQVHQAGGLLYYDGANLNAIAGKVRPADMGFDVMHMNLHKTFATPHGGGGPGAGPVAANKRLAPYLPIPRIGMREKHYYWLTEHECPHSIGRLSTFMGNAGILLRAYIYLRMLGREGVERISEFATLNANYLMSELQKIGIELAYPKRRASHEFVITFTRQAKTWSVTARDLAKRLLDYGFHAPTTYFPLLIPECWLIEPTETETKETLDGFVSALASILKEAEVSPELVQTAPHTLPVGRLDDIKAAKDLDVVYKIPEAS